MTNEDLKTRGEHAARLLEDALLKETLETLRYELYEQFSKTKYSEKEKREEIWALQRHCDLFANTLRSFVMNGEYAKAQLDKEIKDRQKKRSGIRRFFNK